MKKLLVLFALFIVSLQFFSCSTDYDGKDPVNQDPIINIYDTSDITSSKKTKIQWYGNDIDGTKLNYYYTVTTDTTLNATTVLTALPLTGLDSDGKPNWTKTDKTYAYISMPYGPYHSTTVFMEDTTYTMTGEDLVTINVPFKAVYSKFFVYGVDEEGNTTETTTKIFRRTNRIPKHPMVFSSKLGVNGFDQYWMTVGADSAQMVLREATSFWKPFDFKWMGEDPDGTDVDLEFKWELYERGTSIGDSLVTASAGWSINNLSKSFDDEIFDNDPQGKYSFRVYVRDDAFEESLNNATVNFEVFAPQFDKGILFINDTDSTLTQNVSYMYYEGNPVESNVKSMYRSLFEASGFTDDSTDPLKSYDIVKFQVETELVRIDTIWTILGTDTTFTTDSITVNFYSPNIRKLSEYRMVIIASEDRSNENGIDYSGSADNPGYAEYLGKYLDVGGKVFIIGHSALMKKQPYRLEVNSYIAPTRQVFDPNATAVAELADITLNFFHDYFGIYSVKFPETKTWFSQAIWNVRPSSVPLDYYLQENYDFIGVSPYEHISDAGLMTQLKVDSAKVNDSWKDFFLQIGPNSYFVPLSLKENGSVLTGIPTLEAFKGEAVYRYKSIYDLPKLAYNTDMVYEVTGADTLKHNLKYIDPILTDGDKSDYINRKSGTIATRFISEGDINRTALFAFPLFYLQNENDEVTNMFKSMIEWFELDVNPLAKK